MFTGKNSTEMLRPEASIPFRWVYVPRHMNTFSNDDLLELGKYLSEPLPVINMNFLYLFDYPLLPQHRVT
jgi:hypothetical protein